MQCKTRGMILKQRPIGENDRMLTILTEDMGVIEASAKGAKSVKSPLSGASQVMAYSELCLFKGRQSYYILDSAEMIASFYPIRLDVEKLALAVYLCELTHYLAPTAEHSSVCLRFLLNTLHLMQEGRMENDLLKAIYELRMLSIGGFMPNLVGCEECGRYEPPKMYFLPLDGILVCGDCFLSSQHNTENAIRFLLPAPVLAAMRHILFSETERAFSFKLTGDSLSLLARITETYTLLHTEGRFKSLEVYHSLKC